VIASLPNAQLQPKDPFPHDILSNILDARLLPGIFLSRAKVVLNSEISTPKKRRAQPIGISVAPKMAGQARGEGGKNGRSP
jgi:hypothetical protein